MAGPRQGKRTFAAFPGGLRGLTSSIPIVRIPVLVDSGFRRETDVIKAFMGAQAVCIGRPYLWGLGAFGQPGVERVLDILRTELVVAMQQIGAPSLKDLKPAMVVKA